ncbi:MAG: aminoacyl-tRNA hydrolase [Myxococcales bacterium]|nr:aminoacyl-tRNA hydrolase [Myxococcales bacterium]
MRYNGRVADDLELGGVVIPSALLTWTAVRASGAGGQNVNKVSSKVRLSFDIERCEQLSARVRERLRALAKGHLDAEGFVVLTSQRTRNQLQNIGDARAKLAELIRAALAEPVLRRATKPTRASRGRRLTDKRTQADKKRARGTESW